MAQTRKSETRTTTGGWGSITGLIGAMAEGSIELAAGSARWAGQLVGDLADDCAKVTVGRGRQDEDDEHEGCGCEVTPESLVDQCVHVLDDAMDRFHDALDAHDSTADEAASKAKGATSS